MNRKILKKKINRNRKSKIEQENQKGVRQMKKHIILLVVLAIIVLTQGNFLAQHPSLILPLKWDQVYRITIGYGGEPAP